MANGNINYSRRVSDLISQVKSITQEVDDFLQGKENIGSVQEYIRRKDILLRKQALAQKSLNRALVGQREILGRIRTGEPLPKRRAEESADIEEIKRRAGIT